MSLNGDIRQQRAASIVTLLLCFLRLLLSLVGDAIVRPAFLGIVAFQGLLRLSIGGSDEGHQFVHLLYLGCYAPPTADPPKPSICSTAPAATRCKAAVTDELYDKLK